MHTVEREPRRHLTLEGCLEMVWMPVMMIGHIAHFDGRVNLQKLRPSHWNRFG